jgi:hypothetical protein
MGTRDRRMVGVDPLDLPSAVERSAGRARVRRLGTRGCVDAAGLVERTRRAAAHRTAGRARRVAGTAVVVGLVVDLFAITLLSVDSPSPRVSRQILGSARSADDINRHLRSDDLNEDIDLAYAAASTLPALYEAVKRTLGHNP